MVLLGLGSAASAQTGSTDYSSDGSRIDVSTAEQLNAMRWDLDGDGVPVQASRASYSAAFPDAAPRMGCASTCTGYVLRNDIDLSVSRWSSSSTEGWAPIGGAGAPYIAQFDGDGHVVRNLFINRGSQSNIGLFGQIGKRGRIEGLGLSDAVVTGGNFVGALAGQNEGEIIGSHAIAAVSGGSDSQFVGGLAGYNFGGVIRASYAIATVRGNTRVGGLVGWNAQGEVGASYAIATVNGSGSLGVVGGLMGGNAGTVRAGYAIATVRGNMRVGGLLGSNNGGTVTASYTIATVSGSGAHVGALVGFNLAGTITDSYWDSDVSDLGSSVWGVSKTTIELQTPIAATGIYSTWDDVDVDGDNNADEPWDFGTDKQYPVLRYGGLSTATQLATQLAYDARLQSITISPGTLAPVFDGNVTSYTAVLNRAVSVLTVTATAAHSSASVVFSPADADEATGGHQVRTSDVVAITVTSSRGNSRRTYTLRAAIDYSSDGSRIDVRTAEQLNAMRWDLDGNGNPDLAARASYSAAFPNAMPRMGCDSACKGYVLRDDIDLGVSRWSRGSNNEGWAPIGTENAAYDAPFDGAGHVVRNLYINRSGQSYIGLFGRIFSDGRIERLGLIDAVVTGNNNVGALVGWNNRGKIIDSHAIATVSGNTAVGGFAVGGLVGDNTGGEIRASYAIANVVGNRNVGGLAGYGSSDSKIRASYAVATVSVSGIGNGNVGGLLGFQGTNSEIRASYAIATVRGRNNVGGLVGNNFEGTVIASYAVATATATATGGDGGGLVGSDSGDITVSYWDTDVSGLRSSAGGTSKTTSELQTPTAATGIYSTWDDVDVDGDNNADEPWNFGTHRQYPVLQYGGLSTATQFAAQSANDARLRSLTLSQGTLAPVFDGNVTGYTAVLTRAVSVLTVTATAAHSSAAVVFSPADADETTGGHQVRMADTATITVTSSSGRFRKTYTLRAAIDYSSDDTLIDVRTAEQLNAMRWDLNGDGMPTVAGRASYSAAFPDAAPRMGCASICTGYVLRGDVDLGVSLWGRSRGGAGWAPIGADGAPYAAEFDGAGRIVRNLYINRGGLDNVGLFGNIGEDGSIKGLGVVNADVTGRDFVGALAGSNSGEIIDSHASATVTGNRFVGGLAGSYTGGKIRASYAIAAVSGDISVGGLAGFNERNGEIRASYAVAAVRGDRFVGGLAGASGVGEIAASYAIATVSGDISVGGLAGSNSGMITASYWDTDVSGLITSAGGAGKTTSELRTPTAATGIYLTWDDVDVDGDDNADEPWDFGTDRQYPVLRYGVLSTATQFAAQLANDAGLRSLTLSPGVLQPAFDGGVTGYTALVDAGVSVLTVTATAAHSSASVVFSPADADEATGGHQVRTADAVAITVTSPSGRFQRAYTLRLVIDYSSDDGRIDVRTAEQLNAMRWDLDGDGVPAEASSASYSAAFPGALPGMGCASTCTGYVLRGDVDLGVSRWGRSSSTQGWAPIGARRTPYTARFDGAGRVVRNLFINRSGESNIGLFGRIAESGRVERLGLIDAVVVGSDNVGGLAGYNEGEIIDSHASATVTGNRFVGGLAGFNTNGGEIRASYAVATVNSSGSSVGGLAGGNTAGEISASYAVATVNSSGSSVGGLAGGNTAGEIRASYAIATVNGSSSVGGLAGDNGTGGIAASYAVATVSGDSNVGGLAGSNSGMITDSYWDTDVSGLSTSAGGTSKTTIELRTPTAATGIYLTWDDVDVDGDDNADEPWDFGTDRQYPVLRYGVLSTATQFATQLANDADLRSLTLSPGVLQPAFDGGVTGHVALVDTGVSVLTVTATAVHSLASVVFFPADADEETGGHQVRTTATVVVTVTSSSGRFRKTYTLRVVKVIDYSSDDGRIDVRTAEQLNAMRWDLDGDGVPVQASSASYSAVFPDAAPRMGCASTCTGYVLRGDVDLGVSRWGRSRSNEGWAPIGADGAPYAARFDGAGRVVRNLFINRSGESNIGLFGRIAESGRIERLGLIDAVVIGRDSVGALAGSNQGEIIDSHASVTVGGDDIVGGLVGSNTRGKIRASYAIATVSGDDIVGGLVGFNDRNGEIRASYAVAAVNGSSSVGGLAGDNGTGGIAASYAVATVSGDSDVGGLAGSNSEGSITASYWDTDVSGLRSSAGGTSKTTIELRTPTAATGIYLTWDDVDVDGDDNADEPWDFGTDRQYPVLRYGVLSTATQFATQLANDADLRSLTLSPGVLQSAFDGGVTGHTALVDAGVSVLTVTATAAQSSAAVVFSPADADEETGGHQVRTTATVAITVTSPSGRFQRAYTLRLVIDYSSDDGRIDVRTAEQLNAMRWDLDGDGVPAEASSASYSAAFPDALPGMGCASTCTGYVLRNDIDLGVSRWGSSSTQGWAPIGTRRTPYVAQFDGAGRVVRNLFISRSGENNIGLFGRIAESGRVERLRLINAVVIGGDSVGALAGSNSGEIIDSHASATVTGNRFVGGLAGFNTNGGEIRASYAVATVNSSGSSVGGLAGGNTAGEIRASYAVATVNSSGSSVGGLAGGNTAGEIRASYAVATVNSSGSSVGGLAGDNTAGEIRASYAIATVNGSSSVGGLAGDNGTGGIAASYAVATVSGDSNVGGLAGSNSGMITDSYWDTDVSGLSTSAGGAGKTTIELRTPTAATGIYLTWDDVDVDGDDNADEPWDFGTDRQYPVLRYGVLSTATQFATQLANDADLRSLTLSPGVLQPAFDGEVTGHVALVDTGVSVLTVTATAVHSLASVVFSPEDADEEAGGHQVRTTDTVVAITVTSSSGRFRKTYTLRVVKVIDYSSDDGRIDVRTAEQLNAMRWDLDGDGVPTEASSASYSAAFPDAAPRMGCASTCTGYVLRSDIDLGVSRWGRSRRNEGWAPIGADGAPYAARFDGAGRVVRNLFINRSGESNIGLFGRIAESGRVERLGLIDAVVVGSDNVGGLAGYNEGGIIDSHASATVTGNRFVGGLAGFNTNGGEIRASYAVATVNSSGSSVGGLAGGNTAGEISASYAIATVNGSSSVGGLAGNNTAGEIRASYAIATVNGSSSVGGLAGDNGTGGIAASYAVATVSGDSNVGGLAGSNSEGSITASYWDTDVSGLRSSAGGAGKTTIELRTPTAATGIYSTWDDVDVDGDDNADEPWDFGTDRQYPVLRYGVLSTATQFATQLANDADLRSLTLSPGVLQPAFDGGVTGHVALVDTGVSVLTVTATAVHSLASVVFFPADADEETGGHQVRTTATVVVTVTSSSGRFRKTYTLRVVKVIDYSSDDGRIDVRTAEQLNAMRWDLDGDGVPVQASSASYSAAFPDAAPRMGCASTCTGYVLRNDIDLGVSRWGRSNSTTGWVPIGDFRASYDAHFDGAGRVVRNLFINRDDGSSDFGLFGRVGGNGRIEGLGLADAFVIGANLVGALAGTNLGEIIDSHAIATVSGSGEHVGGLVGYNFGGVVRASYAVATVSGQRNIGGLVGYNVSRAVVAASYAITTVDSDLCAGGLVGLNSNGQIRASYAIATVDGDRCAGGLVGDNDRGAVVAASYAVATVGGNSEVGGLAGENSGNIEASYWDTDVSGLFLSAGGTSKTTSELQTPTTAAGIYSTWDDVDVDGDTEADDPWDFGTNRHYPVLQYGGLSTATQFVAQPGNNASLQSLVLSQGALTPAFDGEVTSYTAIMGNEVSLLTVTATAVQDSASVAYSPADEDETAGGHQVGPTATVVITVTSLNQTDERSYAVALTQAPFSDLDLTSLVLSAGALAPGFTGALTDYRAEVSVSSLTVTAGFSQAASATVNGNALTSGQPSDGVALALGVNTLAIKVGAGGATKTYTVSVTRTIDYDDDGDGLLSVTTLEQLNAIRWDLDGDGRAFGPGYVAAFPYAATGMGCPSSGCMGYELDADLDFDTDNNGVVNADDGALSWGAGADAGGGWLPVNNFAATFMGNGRVISNLFISRGESSRVGLFGRINAGGKVEGLGLADAVVAGKDFVGGLAGENAGEIIGSYAIATVSGGSHVGGLVGLNNAGAVGASYAIATVSGGNLVGGLVGRNANGGGIRACYVIAAVDDGNAVGGLVGWNDGGAVAASYVVATVSGDDNVSGLAGANAGMITDSYYDTDVSGLRSGAEGTTKTTVELQTPTNYAGIYSEWNVDVDGDNDADDPWDFGTDRQYPVLQYGDLSTATQFVAQLGSATNLRSLTLSQGVLAPSLDGAITSYAALFVNTESSVLTVTATAAHSSASVAFSPADADEATGGHQVRTTAIVTITVTAPDRLARKIYTLRVLTADNDYSSDGTLIDVRTAEQLNAMRWDPDGDGVPVPADTLSYFAVFPNPLPRMGCASTCTGYVLRGDVDLGLSRWGRSRSTQGWAPIGARRTPYTARFDGAGHVVRNLFISRSGQSYIGLFGRIGGSGRIERLRLIDAVVIGGDSVGALAGSNQGEIIDSHASASVSGNVGVGGLVGDNTNGEIRASYAVATVNSYGSSVGGLAGNNTAGEIRASYAIATVNGSSSVGGLAGDNGTGGIAASYAVATVSGDSDVGGLAGSNSEGSITASYWDTDVSGLRSSAGGTSKTTIELRTPTAATGIYLTWDDVDVDGDDNADEPWDFGTDRQYPVLRYGVLSTATQFAAQLANDADLRSLTLSPGVLQPAFDGEVTGHTALVDTGVSVLTVTATAVHSSAAVVFSLADADEEAGGHQVRTTDTVVAITVTSSSGRFRKTYTLRVVKVIDYSSDDGRIDVRTAEQLNAMRWDLDGDGVPTEASSASYSAVFPDAAPRMGCASTCTGYVLRSDIDLGVSRWGRSRRNEGWAPIGADGAPYAARFDGAGRVVRNLFINRSGENNIGLFGRIAESGRIERLGLIDAVVVGSDNVGGLAGYNEGEIIGSHASATVTGNRFVGGLAGLNTNGGEIRASYAVATVNSSGSSVGGLAGGNTAGEIRASYAIATVNGSSSVGGLAGDNGTGGIAASYAIATVSGDSDVGGLAGSNSGMITDSYWDTDVSGLRSSAGGTSKTTIELRTPTAATGIYLTWDDVDVDGDDNADEPWDFGTDRQYPVLRYGVLSTATQFATQLANDADLRSLTLSPGVLQPAFDGGVTGHTALVDTGVSVLTVTATAVHSLASVVFSPADADEETGGHQVRTTATVVVTVTSSSGRFRKTYTLRVVKVIDYSSDDGRIDVRTAEQLNAMRWDLDGDGVPTEASSASYSAVFPDAAPRMGCASTCTGYVLRGDVDLGVSRWGRSRSTQGWAPIGARRTPYTARFDGAGHVVRNLFISRSGQSYIGLFGRIAESGRIEGLGLINAVVIGGDSAGALAGSNSGEIIDSHAIASVSGNVAVGGLVGDNTNGEIRASYAIANVVGDRNVGGLAGYGVGDEIKASYAVATVGGVSNVGGLAGFHGASAEIRASYAVATVGGGSRIGGLVGNNAGGEIAASYAVATVGGGGDVGGLAGLNSGRIAASYWDTDVSGLSASAGGAGKTTRELQTPTTAAGIYSTWDDVDVDGDNDADDPWDFGTDRQYPVLQYGVLSTATQLGLAMQRAAQPFTDASLRSLTLSQGVLAPPFDGAITSYTVLVSERVPVLTVAAIAAQSAASVAYSPADADETTGGYQLRTTDAVVITVTAPNGLARRTYALSVTRGGLPTVNVTVRPKVFLQGAYDRASGRMKTTYKELLPALSPYGAVRDVDLSGLLNGARFGLSAVTDTVVDWVLVELRATTHGIAAATSSTVRDRRAALLLSDGRVVGVNPGAASPPAAIALGHVALSISEDDLIDGNDLYLLIRHRNHLPVMTTATGGGGCETDYCADFTRRQSWQDGQHDMGGGFYAMFAGDADRDGDIDFDDEAAIRRHNLTAVTGGGQYTSGVVNGDLDFDGDVLSSDRLFILINGARRACAVCYP